MSTENLQTDVDKEAISKFNHEFNLLFKKSDALKRLKEVSETLDLASFKKFSLVAMKTAYDKNRFKAVDMMLNFHEQNYPPLLLQLHLAVLLNNKSSDDYPGDNMLKVITQHYTSDFILEKLEDMKNYPGNLSNQKKKDDFIVLEKVIFDLILPQKSSSKSTKFKI